ncbi:2-dehydro-3-deoxy-6-phosphogalactonate aldolase [Roseospira visakhapatnamensis]|uniref:2-dehydro-3-deoxyphosphogalactonate aldolase n=1 Tax=Roseospira visakhapatnamensis TaxID=390880 RepID=A0A7W6RBR1_9PROT|nr:2-dehydro-3-deoxy-6-phosphogalactonate aldolase [Roseospira visakhapatnamensis]MBB4265522.1 2-dehydro-3-deoxyphosphogalactonate aldolase [Roseospira visakhapatnamensis]
MVIAPMIDAQGAAAGGAIARFDAAFTTMPLVAVLRGVTPDEVLHIAGALIAAGFTMLEVPLNSPEPFESIALLQAHCPPGVVVGAGTVLTPENVGRLAALGADLVVTPNTDTTVVDATVRAGLVPVIGCMTPSEALQATRHGARALKVFPAAALGPAYLRDIRAVLPPHTRIVPLGGIDRDSMAAFRAAGADGFGFGSSLYKPGRTAAEVGALARTLVTTWRTLTTG